MEKSKKVKLIVKIILLIGWIYLFGSLISLSSYVGKQYKIDSTNFEINPETMQACKPMLFFNDLYLERVHPKLNFAFVLLIFTILFYIDSDFEWIKKLEKLSENMEQ